MNKRQTCYLHVDFHFYPLICLKLFTRAACYFSVSLAYFQAIQTEFFQTFYFEQSPDLKFKKIMKFQNVKLSGYQVFTLFFYYSGLYLV